MPFLDNDVVYKRFELAGTAVILLVSAYLFAKFWWGQWLFMAIVSSGALFIIGAWIYRRRIASPLNLLAAALLFLYYANLPAKLVPYLTWDKSPATYDAFLFYVDRSFGFSPSLLVVGWVGSVPHLNELFFGVYMGLSLAMGICFAAHMGQTRPPWKIAWLLIAAVTVGVLCYNLLPACGPLMLLGRSGFLHGDGTAAYPGTQPAVVQLALKYPRNAMPSLHMTWALILLWISRDLKRGHWAAAIFATLTAVATLSTGEHYLVDLVAAFPFALAIWNLCVGDTPLSHPRRMLCVVGGTAGYLAWIVVIRVAPSTFYLSPAVPWLAAVATVGGTLFAVYSQPALCFVDVGTAPPPQKRVRAVAVVGTARD